MLLPTVLLPTCLLLNGPARHAPVRAQVAAAPATTSSETKIAAAKEFLLNGNGFYSAPQPDLFAEDFVFRAPVVGPLCKSDYLETMNLFSLWTAMPDIEANDYGWCQDPTDPNTVRVYVRNTGTQTAPLNVGSVSIPASNKKYCGTTESIAITLNEDNKVKCLQAGYVVDRFSGNGNGLGAVAGILSAIGLPVPKTYSRVFRFSQWLGNTFGQKFGPRTISKEEDLPAWWSSSLRGTEGL